MVSSGNLAILGLALVAGFFILRGSNNTVTDGSNGPIPIQENPQIQILKDAISGVQGFIKTTFKAPILPKCKGPNCLGIFQAKGTRSAFDPFTGQRLAVGGSSKFQQITGSNFALNQSRITQGQALFTQTQNILGDLQGQLNILQTKSV